MIFLLFQACPAPCEGVACGEDYSAALVGVLTAADDLQNPPSSPQQTPFTINGTTEQGSDWSMLINEGAMWVGSPKDGSVYYFSDELVGVVTTDEASGLVQGDAGEGFGTAIAQRTHSGGTDLLVGAPLRDSDRISRQEGAVYWFADLGDGPSAAFTTAAAHTVVTGTTPAARFGSVIVTCEDMDGDGEPDWAASAPWDSSNQPLSGMVALALSATLNEQGERRSTELGAFWTGVHTGARLGAELNCRHDLTGDQVPDLVISAPFADEDGKEGNGGIYLISGSDIQSGPLFSADVPSVHGLAAEDWLGWSFDIGDLNADGYPELAAGAPGAQEGAGEVLVWNGRDLQAGITTPLARIVGEDAGDNFGRTVRIADLNMDGAAELLIGAPHVNPLIDDPDGFFSGALYVFKGAPFYQGWLPLLQAEDATVVLSIAQQFLQTGQHISIGDFTGDGSPDVGLLLSTVPQ